MTPRRLAPLAAVLVIVAGSPAHAIGGQCVGTTRVCTMPNGAPGHTQCEDGIWVCGADPGDISVRVTLSDARYLYARNYSYVPGGPSGGGKLLLGQRDNNVQIAFNATDPDGISNAWVDISADVTCGKAANAPIARHQQWSVPAARNSAARVSLTVSQLLAAGSPPGGVCSDGSPADEVQLTVSGTKITGTGAWVSTPASSVQLVATLRVMAWNIRHGSQDISLYCDQHGDDPACMNADVQRSMIQDAHPDIVLLQEVDISCARSNYLNEPAYYAAAQPAPFPYTSFFLQGINPGGCGSYYGQFGDAILSRFPISSSTTLDAPNARYGHGGIGRVTIVLPPVEFAAYTAHIDNLLDPNGPAQHNFLCQQIATYGVSATKVPIWGGDFNSDLLTMDFYYPYNACSWFPRINLVQDDSHRVDHLFLSPPSGSTGFTWLAGGTFNTQGNSDHFYPWGVFRINAAL